MQRHVHVLNEINPFIDWLKFLNVPIFVVHYHKFPPIAYILAETLSINYIIFYRIYKSESKEYGCKGDFDICCKIECGKSKTYNTIDYGNYDEFYDALATRILGENNDAEYAEFPWMLGILQNKAYRCGASLIHPQVAITAAHCVNKDVTYKVRAGEWNWLMKNEPLLHQDRFTEKVLFFSFTSVLFLFKFVYVLFLLDYHTSRLSGNIFT